MAFNFLGDSLRDALDPRTSRTIETRRPVTPVTPLLEIEDLRILLRAGDREVALVDGVTLGGGAGARSSVWPARRAAARR